jgi:hypothetical protein
MWADQLTNRSTDRPTDHEQPNTDRSTSSATHTTSLAISTTRRDMYHVVVIGVGSAVSPRVNLNHNIAPGKPMDMTINAARN